MSRRLPKFPREPNEAYVSQDEATMLFDISLYDVNTPEGDVRPDRTRKHSEVLSDLVRKSSLAAGSYD